jgi:hypothetical protein
MSLDGVINIRGSTCTVRRPTETKAADKTTVRSWADAATGLKVLLDEVAAGKAQHLWGRETEARISGFAPSTSDVRVDDVLIVTAGAYIGQKMRVVEAPSPALGPARKPLALARTVEKTS